MKKIPDFKIAALITCHNRKDKTLKCLEALFENCLPIGSSLQVILVDDASTDGTDSTVNERFPDVETLRGDGTLFWNGGMYKAFARALEIGFDGYLWLNDDTILYPTALQNLIDVWREQKAVAGEEAIYIGSTQDSQTKLLTYGGLVRQCRFKPFRYNLVQPRDVPIECHTMNGNCVFISRQIATRLGNLEPRFAHAMGDIDYGLRAGQVGIKVLVVPGFVGVCDKNLVAGSFNDRALSARERWQKMMQPKGLPPSSWLVLTRRHGGPLWPLYWMSPYLKIWF